MKGIGAKTERQLLEALAGEAEPRARRGLLLTRARELVGSIATAVGGEPAGDGRRWRDSCEQLAVVCATEGRCPAGPVRLLASDRRPDRAEAAGRGRDGRGVCLSS